MSIEIIIAMVLAWARRVYYWRTRASGAECQPVVSSSRQLVRRRVLGDPSLISERAPGGWKDDGPGLRGSE